MTGNQISKESRAFLAGGFILIALLIIAGGLFYHQIIKHQKYLELSENNRIRIQPIIPKRGLIYDCNRQVLGDNRLSFTVSMVPAEKEKDVTIPRLAELLDMDTTLVIKRARANFVSNYIPSPIKRGQGIDVVSILEEQQENYPGITYGVESVRQYVPEISVQSFIGHVGEVSPDELNASPEKRYRAGAMIGKKGIEKKYDNLLRGIEGTDYREVTARGQIVGSYQEKDKIPAVPGADLVLTINRDLQAFIAEVFDTIGYNGSVVAIDPRNGEVLGLASFPGFNPNIFSGVISPEIWQEIISDTSHPLLNRPVAGLFPPASPAKLLSAGAALELGLITEDMVLKSCRGGMQFGNRFFRCWDHAGHDKLDIFGAIEQSCDVYFYQVGQMMGVDAWAEYAFKCGFGKPTGIDITGELKGIVPTSDYYDNLYGPRKWSPFLILNLIIGQGEFTITPLQMAQFYCGLANNGKVYRPHLLKEIIHFDGTVEVVEPELSFRLPFSQRTLDILYDALFLVVQGEHGTARGRKNKNYNISGKTGTAQNPHGLEHSWFVAYAPSESPRIVVTALVENAGHGSEVAAPLTAQIIEFYLANYSDILADTDK